MPQGLLQQDKCTYDVGLDECDRTVDRTVDVALGGQIHHQIGPVGLEQATKPWSVANVRVLEPVAGMVRGIRDRVRIGGVGQLVDIDDPCGGFAQQRANGGRADEARAPSHEDGSILQAFHALVTWMPGSPASMSWYLPGD